MRVGVVGCGAVSDRYFAAVAKVPGAEVVACTDASHHSAERSAAAHGVRNLGSVAALLNDPEVDLVLNLTPPAVHGDLGIAVLKASKHLYNEKPLATDCTTAAELVDLSQTKGLLIGSAPDTLLGGAHQTARAAIERGAIGVPIAASVIFLNKGYEHSRPNPRKYYSGPGAGPTFSPGLYFMSSLVSLFGPVCRVVAVGRRAHPTRVVSFGPTAGEIVTVGTDTHIAALVEFDSGQVATVVTSFDVTADRSGIEVYGTEGILRLPDPRQHGGPVRARRADDADWSDVDGLKTGNDYCGVGLVDMILGARSGREHRLSGEFCYHIVEATSAIQRSIVNGEKVAVVSRCVAPPPLRETLLP